MHQIALKWTFKPCAQWNVDIKDFLRGLNKSVLLALVPMLPPPISEGRNIAPYANRHPREKQESWPGRLAWGGGGMLLLFGLTMKTHGLDSAKDCCDWMHFLLTSQYGGKLQWCLFSIMRLLLMSFT